MPIYYNMELLLSPILNILYTYIHTQLHVILLSPVTLHVHIHTQLHMHTIYIRQMASSTTTNNKMDSQIPYYDIVSKSTVYVTPPCSSGEQEDTVEDTKEMSTIKACRLSNSSTTCYRLV